MKFIPHDIGTYSSKSYERKKLAALKAEVNNGQTK
jgi:hypothetical protein